MPLFYNSFFQPLHAQEQTFLVVVASQNVERLPLYTRQFSHATVLGLGKEDFCCKLTLLDMKCNREEEIEWVENSFLKMQTKP